MSAQEFLYCKKRGRKCDNTAFGVWVDGVAGNDQYGGWGRGGERKGFGLRGWKASFLKPHFTLVYILENDPYEYLGHWNILNLCHRIKDTEFRHAAISYKFNHFRVTDLWDVRFLWEVDSSLRGRTEHRSFPLFLHSVKLVVFRQETQRLGCWSVPVLTSTFVEGDYWDSFNTKSYSQSLQWPTHYDHNPA
jgi:hypothetical protein